MELAALKRDLDGLKIEDNAKLVQQKSRDFYWYSPVLKRQLDDVTADLVVSPRDEAEVIRVLAACHRHGVPVTPRGTGTGNYGQAMPLAGGAVLSLANLTRVVNITSDSVRAEAGVILEKLDEQT
jgi:FAD/FMN-containing dehydrogenase